MFPGQCILSKEDLTVPLRIELKPYELIIVNGARIRNGERRTDFLIENNCNFLRESEMMRAEDVKTPYHALYLQLQSLHLGDAESISVDDITQFIKDKLVPGISNAERSSLTAVVGELNGGSTHKALKACKKLL